VEHPITELVTGEDLVEHMLYIAAGKPLPERLIKTPHLDATGSAIESRVYAEDPLRYAYMYILYKYKDKCLCRCMGCRISTQIHTFFLYIHIFLSFFLL
jgi:biotin carboxylase